MEINKVTEVRRLNLICDKTGTGPRGNFTRAYAQSVAVLPRSFAGKFGSRTRTKYFIGSAKRTFWREIVNSANFFFNFVRADRGFGTTYAKICAPLYKHCVTLKLKYTLQGRCILIIMHL